MEAVQRVTLLDAFDATGKYVPKGHIGTFDADKIEDTDTHLVDPGELPGIATVQIAAIAPAGPNPTAPQQLPADAVQGPGGGYMIPGKNLVGEVTRPQEERIDQAGLGDPDLETEVSEALAKIAAKRGIAISDVSVAAMSAAAPASTGPADGTVKEVTADLGGKTDEQLAQLRDAENAREGGARVSVTKAIDAELAKRAETKTE